MPHCALLPLRGSRHTHDLRGHSPKVPHGYHQSPGRAPGRDPHQGLSLTCSSFSKNDFILSMGFCVSSCSAFNIICFVFVTSSSLSQLEYYRLWFCSYDLGKHCWRPELRINMWGAPECRLWQNCEKNQQIGVLWLWNRDQVIGPHGGQAMAI